MLILFYGNQEFGRYATWKELKVDIFPHTQVQSDIYNGGYVYKTDDRNWYRCYDTPVLIEDVPKHLRMLQLVFNL